MTSIVPGAMTLTPDTTVMLAVAGPLVGLEVGEEVRTAVGM